MIYKCSICNYSTKDKSNLNKHFKTKNHKKNILINSCKTSTNSKDSHRTPIGLPKKSTNTGTLDENNYDRPKKSKYTCDYCKSTFTRRNNLGRHIQRCLKKKSYDEENELKKQLKLKDKEMEIKNKEIEHYKEEMDHYKTEIEYYRNIINAAGSLIQKSMSSFSFINNNFENAPKIEQMKESDIKLLDENKSDFIDLILYHHNHKTLNKFIGDYIIKVYKKKKPEEQSIWNTDSSRLTYIIKDLIDKKSSKWKIDKKGIKTKKFLINPVLEYIKNLLDNNKSLLLKKIKTSDTSQYDIIFEKVKIITEINKEIKDNILCNDILKYISPHFYFDKDSIKKIKLIKKK
jgi:hypothetical protein